MLRTYEENCSNSPFDEHFEQLETPKTEYHKLYEDIAKGAIIRSKATWYDNGEKSNNFFLNLESHNKIKSPVQKIFNSEGTLITDPKKYDKKLKNLIANSFLKHTNMPKLSQADVHISEGKLSISECYKSLLPEKTLSKKGRPRTGGKQAKQRLT